MIWKSCPRCGKIHPKGTVCKVGAVFRGGEERNTRSTNRWTQKSLEIRERAHWMCEFCKSRGEYTTEGLEVHHIQKLKNAPTLAYDDSNLVCLCERCHSLADRGEISQDILRKLAEARDK